MRRFLQSFLTLSLALVSSGYATRTFAEEASSKAPPLSPADSIATMQVADGFSVVPVLSEPHIHEPTAIAWDGNGRLYVVEMRTYMQDIDGNDQLAPTSRVSRHEDTNGTASRTSTLFLQTTCRSRAWSCR
ncbi:MAG: hypothetical protein WBD20_26910 [Pirellulaceae bacterium]